MGRLVDGFGRRFHYLRLSVTEVCNFRCTYCLPDGFKKSGPLTFLTPLECERVVRAFADMGVSKVRLTGGDETELQRGADGHELGNLDLRKPGVRLRRTMRA